MERHRTTLSNGLRVVTVTLPRLHRASVVVYARVGARFETRRTSGLSHLVEHMIFRGTERLPDATAFAYAIERFGGTLYAETGIETSLYQVSLPPDQVEGALELLGEVFTRPQFADLEVEKRIIREEILEDLDEAGRDTNVDNVARAAAWPKHSLGFRIPGTLDNVNRFTVDDVRAHFRRFYGARNLVLCVAGAVAQRRVEAAAKRFFGRIPSGHRARSTPPRERQRAPRLAVVQSPGSQTSVQVLARALPERDPAYPALVALARVLDDGLSTRLHRRIVDEMGLAYYVSASLEAFADTGVFEVQAQVEHANAPVIVEEILRLFHELRTRPVERDELDKAKRRFRWDLLAGVDDPDAMAGWFGGGEMIGSVESLRARCAKMDAVRPEQILRIARSVLDRKRLIVAAVGELPHGRLARLERVVKRDW